MPLPLAGSDGAPFLSHGGGAASARPSRYCARSTWEDPDQPANWSGYGVPARHRKTGDELWKHGRVIEWLIALHPSDDVVIVLPIGARPALFSFALIVGS